MWPSMTMSQYFVSAIARSYPTRFLADNAGVEGSVVVRQVKRGTRNEGCNVATKEHVTLSASSYL